MTATPSTMLELGTPMPTFRLPDVDGNVVSSEDFEPGQPVLVAFICPHCPFVRHVRNGFAGFCRTYSKKGLVIVGINSNDVAAFPEDDPKGMKAEAEQVGYVFPYLFDEDQSVAKLFRAACTPDLFLFDRSGKLAYRGQFDSSRPGNNIAVTGADLREASDAVLANQPPAPQQRPSIGCNIKWKPGNAPEYFG